MFLQVTSSLHTDMTQVVEILPGVKQGHIPSLHSQCHGCPGMAADDLAAHGARASATMVLT